MNYEVNKEIPQTDISENSTNISERVKKISPRQALERIRRRNEIDRDLYYGCYSEELQDRKTGPQSPQLTIDEEVEFRNLDKSIENIMNDLMLTSQRSKYEENRRNPQQSKLVPSYYSETDSGIGVGTPKRFSDIDGRTTRQTFDEFDFTNGACPPLLSRGLSYNRSVRSYDSSIRSKNYEEYLDNRFNADGKGFDLESLKSVTIPLGTSDGRQVITKRETTAEEFLKSQLRPTDYDYSSRSSVVKSNRDSILGDFRIPRRPQWANKAQFILACVGYSVGLGNIWRFPYVCYKSGGGAFLLPYFLTLIICGIPLLYMELAVGQITNRGPIGALGKLCPLFKGAGLSSVVISFLMSTYYNVIIAYTLYYFFSAFKASAPWNRCDNIWNTFDCWMPSKMQENATKSNLSLTPAQEFYHNKVLQMTNGIEDMGKFRWELAACLIVAWIMIYFSIWKSVKSSGKVLYFTATLPYFIILAFLIRSLTLEGADVGLWYLFKPRWELLANAKVWVNAAGQIFNSFGIAIGCMISLASYNKSSNKILVDTLSVALVNTATSLMVGIFAFATIGNIATEQGIPVEDVITDGPGLVFEVYPQAMAKMPGSQAWAILFFFMLLCIGLNSQFAIVEVVVTSIQDGFPNWMRKHFVNHEVLVFVVCLVSFICGIPNIFQGGIYFFQLIDHYAASISIMYLAFFEMIAIAWFYGVGRLYRQIKDITGEKPSLYFRLCWCIAAPVYILAIWIFSLIDYSPPSYNNGLYKYPKWAEILGWVVSSLSLICIPAYAGYVWVTTEGATFSEKIKNAIRPHYYECDICNQEKCEHTSTVPCDREEIDILLQEKVQPKVLPAAEINRSSPSR